MVSSALQDLTRHRFLVSYRIFGISYRFHLQWSSSLREKPSIPRRNSSWAACLLNMGPTGYPETSVTNYQPTLRNVFNSEDLKIISLFQNVEVSSGVHPAPNSIVTIFFPSRVIHCQHISVSLTLLTSVRNRQEWHSATLQCSFEFT
jgi:hypothetical protein